MQRNDWIISVHAGRLCSSWLFLRFSFLLYFFGFILKAHNTVFYD
jgi:hypothetical protein